MPSQIPHQFPGTVEADTKAEAEAAVWELWDAKYDYRPEPGCLRFEVAPAIA